MKTYIINKGSHYVRWYQMFPYFHRNIDEVTFEIYPEDSWYWSPKRNSDDGDKNKLFGVGFGWDHHKDSIRIAWTPDFDRVGYINYFAYWYDGGGKKRDIPIGSYLTTQQLTGSFSGFNEDAYIVCLNNKMAQVPNLTPDKNWGFYLRPYVGGDNTSIRKMKFKMSWKGK